MESLDGFKVLKSKWYVVGINKLTREKHIEACCNSKEIAEKYCDEFDRIDFETFNQLFVKRLIVKGEQVKIYFESF